MFLREEGFETGYKELNTYFLTKPFARQVMIVVLSSVVIVTSGCHPPRNDLGTNTSVHSVTSPTQLPPQITIPLTQHNGYLRTRVKINGRDAGLFMLDTGSAHSAVLPVIAKQLGLSKSGRGVATGVGGIENFAYHHVESLSVGSLRLAANRLAGLDDLHEFGDAFGGVLAGLIGYSAFGQAPFTIDYRASTLTVYNPATFRPDPTAVSQPVWIHGGVPAIQAVIGNGHEVWLIVDTGADDHIALPRSCATRWPDIVLTPSTGRGRAKGIGGSVNTIRGWLTSVTLFGVVLENVPVSFEEGHAVVESGRRVVGRVGSHVLKDFRLTFNPGKNRLWIKQQP